MLSGQLPPYVGRFACDWRRLPGNVPGQPQTRARALRASIASGQRTRERSRGRGQRHPVSARLPKHSRADVGGGARGEDVVHQKDPRRHPAAGRSERPLQRQPPLGAGSARLRTDVGCAPDQGERGEAGARGQGAREHFGLVVASRRQPRSRQGHPRDDVGRERVRRDDGTGKCVGDRSPTRELQSVDRAACRPMEQERGAGEVDRDRRTVPARGDRPLRRTSTPDAPRWLQCDERVGAGAAERPRTRAAPGARAREHDIERLRDHTETVAGGADTPAAGNRQGRRISMAARPRLWASSIVRARWVFSSG
jgi:hypothetical protein